MSTTKISRQSPTQDVNNYNLFWIIDEKIGLSNVSNKDMIQITSGRAAASGLDVFLSGSDLINAIHKLPYKESQESTNTESSIDIGFNFTFNNVVYTSIHISPFGWITLDDPSQTWDLQKIIGDFNNPSSGYYDDDFPWIKNPGCMLSGYNSATEATSKTIILAAWWDVLKNYNEILYVSGTSVSGTFENVSKTFLNNSTIQSNAFKHVLHGKNVVDYINQNDLLLSSNIQNNVLNDYESDKFGVRYIRKNNKKFGKSLIIRWNAISFYKKIAFEIVLYENGRIEYRYQPDVYNTLIQTTYTPNWSIPYQYSTTFDTNLHVSKAAIGVFGKYNYAFRDFTSHFKNTGQLKYERGGSIYSNAFTSQYVLYSNYIIEMLPFVATNDVRYDWPAKGNNGAMFVFEPQKRRSKQLPKKDISHEQYIEQIKSSYDDRKSENLLSKAVSFPTKSSRYQFGNSFQTSFIGDLFEGGIETSGTVQSTFDGVYSNINSSIDCDNTFNDTKSIFISQSNSNFYLTGTLPSTQPLFDQSILSKDCIEIDLPLHLTTQLFQTCSGMWYYDTTTKSLSLCNNDNYEQSFGNQDKSSDDLFRYVVPEDYIGFDPFGHLITSGTSSGTLGAGGTYNTTHTQSDDLINVPLTQDNFNAALQKTYNNSVCVNQKYNASSNQTFTLSIEHPFVIEKAEIELPLEAGANWCYDKTSIYHNFKSKTTSLIENINDKIVSGTQFVDMSGPAITCALFHQFDSHVEKRRNLILSATITNEFDNTSNVAVFYGTNTACFSPTGFNLVGGKAASYVKPNSVYDYTLLGEKQFQQFSGTVKMFTEPMVSCGCTAVVRNIAFTSSSTTNRTLFLDFINQQNVDLNVVSTSPTTSGTTININKIHALGRNQQGFQSEGNSIFGRNFSSNNSLNIPNVKTVFNSDLSNWSVFYQTRSNLILVYPVGLTTFKKSPYVVFPQQQLVFSLSKARPRKLFSSIKEDQIFPYWINIYQHDVKIPTGSIKIRLYGSYIKEGKEYHSTKNKIFSAQINDVVGDEPVLDQLEIFNKEMTFDHYYDRFMTGSMLLGTRKKAFNVSSANKTNGILASQASISDYYIQQYELSPTVTFSKFFDENETYYDSIIPNLESIAKLNNGYVQSIYKNTFDWKLNSGSADNTWTWSFPFEGKYSQVQRIYQTIKYSVFTFYGAYDNELTQYGYYTDNNIIAAMCGFGDLNNFTGPVGTKHPIYGTITHGYNVGGGNNIPTFRFKVLNNSQVESPIIRGWKYGLFSGVRLNTHSVFRRGAYGQPRDMLEQRLYGNIIINGIQNPIVEIKFLNSASHTITDPTYTQSSNKSMFCTSSLPYFDGTSRN